MESDIYSSRFFTTSDKNSNNCLFQLPKDWWSRHYEYEWAKQFAVPGETILDAASGINHPFKFYLASRGCKTFACDLDERILNQKEILQDVETVFGATEKQTVLEKYINQISFSKMSLTNLQYQNKTFDKIFCISTLEHLNDVSNKSHSRFFEKIISYFFAKDIYSSLKEFKRVLKNDGLIILTFDYPSINLKYLQKIIPALGLTVAGPKDFSLPNNALYSEKNNLYCFKMVLKKCSNQN